MKELFKKYIDNKCSPDEVKLLLKEFDAGNNEDFLKSLIRQQLETKEDSNYIVEDGAFVKIYSNIKDEIRDGKKQGQVISFYKKKWFRIAAAAVLILAVAGTYLLLNKTEDQQQVAGREQNENDIAPGGNKAVLTLANGSTIILDSAANGMLTQQGNTKVLKLENGQLAYNALNEESIETLYNTITTPRGGQYQLTLSDGSKVWLNAASSLRFPASFTGKERKVELTGEGYFEVAKNASMPFKVNIAGEGEVEVLGTHFNINSYADEATINTTLLEGSVKVTGLTTQESQLITPGQQAQINSNAHVSINKDPDIEQVMAWKNGIFNFDKADLQMVLRQLVRWYDVEIIYEGEIPQREFAGEMQRDLNLSQVLRILEKNDVHFKIEGTKLIVRK